MIEAVVKQDLDQLQDNVKFLAEKYGQDFYFIGSFGIKSDEVEGKSPMNSLINIIGDSKDLLYGVHTILSSEVGVKMLIDGLICHCNIEIPISNKAESDLRTIYLSILKKRLVENTKLPDVDSLVDDFLKKEGFI
jgi:hypothetical protein